MACRAVAVSRAAKASVAVRTTHRPSRAVFVCRAQVEQKAAKVPSFGKADLVNEIMARLDEDTKLKKKDVDAVVTLVLDVVTDKVAQGTRVSVPGFGSFEARHRQARAGRNPKTGEPLDIPAKTVPAFSAGKGFKDKVAAAGK